MSKFRFESLLKLRESERDEKKNAFLEAEERRLLTIDALAALKRELEVSQEESRRARAADTPLQSTELRRFQESRIQITEKIQQTQERLDAVTRETESKREELNAALKEVKILQSLKEKTLEHEMEEERRQAAKKLDEIASQQKTQERRRNLEYDE